MEDTVTTNVIKRNGEEVHFDRAKIVNAITKANGNVERIHQMNPYCVLLMALVTYIPRVLPVTIFRKQIRSKFIRSFLDYTPYAVLGALTFPDVFTSTGHLYSAVGGTIVAVILGYKGKSLVVVAIAAIVTVYLLEMAGGAGLLASLSF